MNCVVAHITRPIEALPMDGRPLSQGREVLARLWRERAGLYAAAADAEIGKRRVAGGLRARRGGGVP